MLNWRIGDVKITRVVEMEVPIPYSEEQPFLREATPEAMAQIPWLSPHFVTREGAMILSIHALAVEAPGMKLVVDTCIGNDRPRSLLQGQALQTSFLEHMTEIGFGREAVDAVVCTHLHVDHVGWNTMLVDGKWVPTFPRARYLIGRKEFEHWNAFEHEETQQIMEDSVRPIFNAGLAETVEMDHRISPEVRLMPTTGHTPGHVSVAIESKGQAAVITGDMVHHPCQIANPDWAPDFDSSKEASTATRRAKFAEWSDKPILVIGTHFAAPTAGHIVTDGATYRLAI